VEPVDHLPEPRAAAPRRIPHRRAGAECIRGHRRCQPGCRPRPGRPNRRRRFPGGGNVDADGFTGDQSPAPTTGTIKLVDGTTIYIETDTGEVITVRTDADTQVHMPGTPADLTTGDQVTVDGEGTVEGTVTADDITKAE
jgi:hypothetical protein